MQYPPQLKTKETAVRNAPLSTNLRSASALLSRNVRSSKIGINHKSLSRWVRAVTLLCCTNYVFYYVPNYNITPPPCCQAISLDFQQNHFQQNFSGTFSGKDSCSPVPELADTPDKEPQKDRDRDRHTEAEAEKSPRRVRADQGADESEQIKSCKKYDSDYGCDPFCRPGGLSCRLCFVRSVVRIHYYPHVEALCAKTREEKFAKAISPMRSQGLRRFDANLVSE